MTARSSCYFSLTRLIGKLFGRDSVSGESSSFEAHLGSGIVFLIPYLFFIQLARGDIQGWGLLFVLIVAAFLVWLFWIVALYLNSFLVRAVHRISFFSSPASRHVQDFLVRSLLTLIAARLATAGSLFRWAGIAWFAFLILNVLAAAILRATNAGSRATAR